MDLGEAEAPLGEFRSLDDLFVRRLRAGARAWPAAEGVAASPVDGVVGEAGRVRGGRVLQAKGRWYTVSELLGDDALADRFRGGSYLTLYLAPRHYHRIHAPVSGRIPWARHIPGRLLPVSSPAVRRFDRLFPRNERLVALMEPAAEVEGVGEEAVADGGAGAVAVVAVGAFNVGRITADFDASLVTNRAGVRAETRRYEPAVRVERGEPLMAFHLGSTVVLLFERPMALRQDLESGGEIRLGEALETLRKAGRGV